MRHKAPSRWVVVNKVWLLAPQAKNRQSNHWRFPCALSELAPWRPQARHIDERQRYTKVPQTVGICFVWTVVQGRCFRHGFQFSASIDTHTEAHSHRQQCALWISSKANPNGNHNTVCAGWQWTILRVGGRVSLKRPPHTYTTQCGLRSKLHHSSKTQLRIPPNIDNLSIIYRKLSIIYR